MRVIKAGRIVYAEFTLKVSVKCAKNARAAGCVRVRCLDFLTAVNLCGHVGFPNTEKGREKNKLAKEVKRMEKYMLVPEKVETIEIVKDGKVVATIEPGEQEEK